jgi:hypothetical protein
MIEKENLLALVLMVLRTVTLRLNDFLLLHILRYCNCKCKKNNNSIIRSRHISEDISRLRLSGLFLSGLFKNSSVERPSRVR